MTPSTIPPEVIRELDQASKGIHPFVIGIITVAQSTAAALEDPADHHVNHGCSEVEVMKRTILVLKDPKMLAAYTESAAPFIAYARQSVMKEVADKAQDIGKHWLSSMFTKDSILNAWNDLVGFVSEQAKPTEPTTGDVATPPVAPSGGPP